MNDLKQEIEGRKEQLIALRRDFHRYPELSFQEKRTASVIEAQLHNLNLEEVRSGLNGVHAVVGTLKGGRPGRTVLIRADIDGLPILEQNEADYCSENRGVMHACGHDGHIAIALTLASVLAARREEIPGIIKFAFQPAEERGGGAKPMIEAGLMHSPEVDAVIGLHIWNNLPAGKIGVCNGPIFAGADTMEVTIRGKGGHGAMPHQTVDALLVGAEIVVALQTLVSREMPADKPAVVTVGSFHSGSAGNIIDEEARLAINMRSINPEAKAYLIERVQQVAGGMARAMRAQVEFTLRSGVPPVVNDSKMADVVRRAGKSILGADGVLDIPTATVSDDMAYFLMEKPGCYFLLGSASDSGETFPHHHPRFDLNEKCLVPGVEVLAKTILELNAS